MSKWNYVGDVNVENGGYWWRQDRPNDNFVEVVDVIPESVMGGPDNVYMIFVGSVYFGCQKMLKLALECCDYKGDAPTLAEKVEAVKAYAGMQTDHQDVIRIGSPDPHGNETTLNPTQIRGNWKLSNYIKKQYL